MKKASVSRDILMRVLDFVNNYITTNKRLCTVKDVSTGLKVTYRTAEKCIETLEREGRIVTVLKIPRKVRVILPKEKAYVIFSGTFIPTWAEDYKLPGEQEILTELEKLRTALGRYQKFKLLLTASGNALVHAVSYSLEFLGFVVTVTEKGGRHDLEFRDKSFYAIAEIKGLQGSANIEDLRQLIDFHLRKIREGQRKLMAYLIVNHYRNLPPTKRGNPFTAEVINAVKTARSPYGKSSWSFLSVVPMLLGLLLVENVLASAGTPEGIGLVLVVAAMVHRERRHSVTRGASNVENYGIS